MEAKAEYKQTQYIPCGDVYCTCGKCLGNEVSMSWWHARRKNWVKTKIFLRKVDGALVAKLLVRGEIICKCGERQTWDG